VRRGGVSSVAIVASRWRLRIKNVNNRKLKELQFVTGMMEGRAMLRVGRVI